MFPFTYGTVYKHLKEIDSVCHPTDIFHSSTLKVSLKLACFKITEHASMFIPTHEPVAIPGSLNNGSVLKQGFSASLTLFTQS